MKILVTGMGIISSIGNNVEENLRSLKNAKDGISSIEGLKNMRKPFLGGQVKITDDEFIEKLGIEKNENIHRSTLLGLTAAKEAWGDRTQDSQIRTGIIYGTTIGGINLNDDLLRALMGDNPSKKMDYKYMHNDVFGTDFIASQIGIKGYKATVNTACSSTANAIMVGARLIKANMLDRVLVGGAEALTIYILNGFDSLFLYDKEKCKPFDENRNGLNLGEAGSFLVIENKKSVLHTGQKKIAELVGWGNACDAFHQTGSSPDGIGAVLAIKQALEMANLSPDSIDYINAHGTGTPNNDLSESYAMKSIFGNNLPPFSSTKSFTGHTLAAAGGVEAIYSILAIQHQLIFPNLNYHQPMKEMDVHPETKLITNKSINKVLSSSFGFGGNCTELIFSA